jgi:hypothetical protein
MERLRSKIDAYVHQLECIRETQRLNPGEAFPDSAKELRSLDMLRDLFVHWTSGMGQRISNARWEKVWNEIKDIDRMRQRVHAGQGGGVLGAPVSPPRLSLYQEPDPVCFQFPPAQQFKLDTAASVVSFVDTLLFGI